MVGFKITEGNPGCLTFLIDAYDQALFAAENGFERMQRAGIRGSRLYKLWNDCCDRNTAKAVEAMCVMDIDSIIKHIDGNDGLRGIPIKDSELSLAKQEGDKVERNIL